MAPGCCRGFRTPGSGALRGNPDRTLSRGGDERAACGRAAHGWQRSGRRQPAVSRPYQQRIGGQACTGLERGEVHKGRVLSVWRGQVLRSHAGVARRAGHERGIRKAARRAHVHGRGPGRDGRLRVVAAERATLVSQRLDQFHSRAERDGGQLCDEREVFGCCSRLGRWAWPAWPCRLGRNAVAR